MGVIMELEACETQYRVPLDNADILLIMEHDEPFYIGTGAELHRPDIYGKLMAIEGVCEVNGYDEPYVTIRADFDTPFVRAAVIKATLEHVEYCRAWKEAGGADAEHDDE